MAKMNGQGLFERHVEKGVLAASALILIITLCVWVASSPRRIPVDSGEYSPSQVDEALDGQAQRLQIYLDKVEPDPPSAPRDLDELKWRILQPYPEGLVFDYVQWQQGHLPLEPFRKSGAERPKVEVASLELLATEQPIAGVNHEVLIVHQAPAEGQSEQVTFKEGVSAHVVAVFPHGQQRKKWDEVLARTSAASSLTVVTVEAERRHRLPDGTWSEGEPVSPVTLLGRGPLPPIPGFTGKNYLEVRQAIAQLASVQQEILEPEFPQIVGRDFQIWDWRIHKPRTRVSDMLAQVAAPHTRQQLSPPVMPGRQPPRRTGPVYGPEGARPRPGYQMREPRPPTTGYPSPPTTRYPSPPTPSYPPGGTTRYPSPPTPSYPPGGTARRPSPPTPSYPPGGTARRPSPPTPGYPRGETVRYPSPPTPGYPRPGTYPRKPGPTRLLRPKEIAPAEAEQREPVLVPSLAEQLANEEGILELWFHDTALTEGMIYSYRVRLVVVNPLFGRFGDVKEEKDAETVKLTIPWSEWSEPVTVNRPTEFFLAGSFRDREEVYVDVFTLKGVQRLKSRFTVRRGEPIGAVVKMEVLGLDRVVRNTEVNFKTGAIAVDFDFDKKVQQPKVKMTRPTTEMLYLDPDGKLKSRTIQEDQDSEQLEKLRNEVQQAPVVAGARL